MAVDAGRIFAEEVDIGVAVDIGDDRPFGTGGTDGDWPGVEDGAGIAARHDLPGALVQGGSLRPLGAKLSERLR